MEQKTKKIILASLVLLLFLGLGSYFTVKVVQSGTISEQLDLGDKFYAEGNYDEAIIAFETVLDIDPRNTEARVGLANALFALNRAQEAERLVKEGINLNPKEPKFYRILADLYIREGKVEEAIATLDNGIANTNDQSLVAQRDELARNISLVAERTEIQVGFDTTVQLIHVDEDGNETILKASEWTLTPDDIATITKGVGNSMVVEGTNSGVAEVTAKLHSIERSIELEVSNQALAKIEFQLKADTIEVGDTVEIVAVGYDFAGNEMDIEPEWLYGEKLGSLSQQAGTTNAFAANEDGLVEIEVIDGDVKSVVSFTVDKKKHQLNTEVEGQGNIVRKPNTTEYEDGSQITLEAVASDGWEFVRWEGDLTGNQKEQQLTMDEEKTVRAIFKRITYRLTTEVTGEGSIKRSSNLEEYPSGQQVTLTAQPRSGWEFVRWEGDLTGSNPERQITMTSDRSVRAVFEEIPPATYELTTSTEGQGTITRSPNKAQYEDGETVTLTATPQSGWEFSHWSGDVSGSSTTQEIVMNADKQVTAVFMQINYQLTVIVVGEGGVVRSPDKTSYASGETVTLTASTATTNSGWEFVRWEGDLTGSNPEQQITMTKDRTVHAVFEEIPPATYELTTTTEGQGTITRSPNKAQYEDGETVTLTATPQSGWEFSHWSGDVSGSSTNQEIAMNADKQVTAVFTQITYQLTKTVEGEGNVVRSPNKTSYVSGETVTLTATPKSGWEFVRWEVDLTGSNPEQQITMTSDRTVRAVFEEIPPATYELTTTTEGQGTITKSPEQAQYDDGEIVTLTAEASEGWQFSHWEGDSTGSAQEQQLTMTSDKNVIAVFEEIGDSSFEGNITHAISGANLTDVKVTIKDTDGNNVTSMLTDVSGNFYIDLLPGKYTFEYSQEGYIEEKESVEIHNGEMTSVNRSLMPKTNEGHYRILLNSDNFEGILDSTTEGPRPDGNRFFVTWNNRHEYYDDVHYVEMHRDAYNGVGPETTTIYKQIEGEYVFSVDNYTNPSEEERQLRNITPRVKVYKGNELVQTYEIPKDFDGLRWYVFSLIGDEFTTLNQASYTVEEETTSAVEEDEESHEEEEAQEESDSEESSFSEEETSESSTDSTDGNETDSEETANSTEETDATKEEEDDVESTEEVEEEEDSTEEDTYDLEEGTKESETEEASSTENEE